MMRRAESLKSVFSSLVLALVICAILPMGTAFAGVSKWVPPATAKSYSFDDFSEVITIDFGLANWGADKFEYGPMQQWWKDHYKINLVMDMVPADYIAQLNARIAARNAPDVWLCPDRRMMYKWADQGVTIGDVGPLIDKYMPTYSKLLESSDKLTAMTIDKKMVGVPFRPAPIEKVWMVRKDWLDNLKLPVPKSFNDIYKVAKAFTEDDPDGNGKKDTYGLNDWRGEVLSAVCAAYGVMGNASGANWQVVNGKLVWDLERPEFKEAMQWWANAVKEGLVYPDWNSPAVSYDQFCTAVASGKFGIFCAPSWWIADPWNTGVKINPKMEWISIPNLKGVNGRSVAPLATPMSDRWMVLNANLLKDPAKLKRVCVFLDQLMSASNEGYLVTFVGTTRDGQPTLGGRIVKVQGKYLAEDQTNCWWFKKSFTYASVRSLDQSIDQVEEGKQLLQADPRRLALQLPARKQTTGIDVVDPLFDLSETVNLAPDQGKYIGARLMEFLTGKRPFSGWSDFIDTVMTKYKGNEMKAIYAKQLRELGIIE